MLMHTWQHLLTNNLPLHVLLREVLTWLATGSELIAMSNCLNCGVNKLKLIKHMGYGRAGFPLLRKPVLHALLSSVGNTKEAMLLGSEGFLAQCLSKSQEIAIRVHHEKFSASQKGLPFSIPLFCRICKQWIVVLLQRLQERVKRAYQHGEMDAASVRIFKLSRSPDRGFL
jgi:hypothetical protein